MADAIETLDGVVDGHRDFTTSSRKTGRVAIFGADQQGGESHTAVSFRHAGDAPGVMRLVVSPGGSTELLARQAWAMDVITRALAQDDMSWAA